MAKNCHALLETWDRVCGMQKKNKINVCISSTIVIVSLVSYGTHYGTHDWTRGGTNFLSSWQSPQFYTKEKSETLTSFLCYTNNLNIRRNWRRIGNIFQAKISETELVFLSVGNDISTILNLNFLQFKNSCFTADNEHLHHCCGYSPSSKESTMHLTSNETNFIYERHVIPDNYIRIEDIINGKPEMVDLMIKVSLVTENRTNLDIIAKHRCRGDVINDPYPEVHINVDRRISSNGSVTKNKFHWFL